MAESKCFLYDSCNHIDCDKDLCIRKYKLNYLYDMSLLSDKQRKHMDLVLDSDKSDLDAFRTLSKLEENIVEFVDNGGSLYIHSKNSGNGKTSWSIRLIQSYLNKIWPTTNLSCKALFISVPRFLMDLKDSISTKNDYIDFIKEHIMEADLVVWDDIATKSSTEFESSQLLRFIDGRVALGKSNIFTSNLNQNELYNIFGSRLTSRIYNNSICLEFVGSDKRVLLYGGK